jgi:DNA-binding Xre family transcriptional regulator
VTIWHIFLAMDPISKRIDQFLQEKNIKRKPFARLAGIDPTQFSRMMRNVRHWTVPHLQAVAEALGVQVGDLTDEVVSLPIVAEIDAHSDTPYPEQPREGDGSKTKVLGEVPAPRMAMGKGRLMLAKMYSLKIKDSSFEPTLPKGSKLIVEREGDKEEGSLVVYCDDSGKLILGRISFHENSVILHSLTPGVKALILPRKRLSSMDRVIGQMFI